ncbi:monocarboxylate transporter 14-like [Patiria miniata]|uniref:Major facilitator superfamily (MFS) profile domain-containing protein n=1 Tax=Patiria miniata TaxID=46514 RepID=A0A913ZT46_PATMI|nr:monocarboxylate transporter 14-like [Patiria miniata]
MSSPENGPVNNYDHDKYGWVMVAVTFLNWAVIMGYTKALGVLLIPITRDLDSELWLIGWLAVLYLLMQNCLGPIVGALCRLLGVRPMMVFGAVLLTLGIILTAISPNVFAMAVFIVGLAGVGSALILFVSFAVMASYFKKKYALAVGLSTMGIPVGVMAYGPVTQMLGDAYGWRGTMLLLGGFSFHLVACSMLVRRNASSSADTEQYQEVTQSDEEENSPSEDGSFRGTNRTNISSDTRQTLSGGWARVCCQSVLKAFDFAVLKDMGFILVVSSRCATSFAYSGVVVYMVSHGQLQGLSKMQASFLPTFFGSGNIIGKLVMPLLQQMGIKVSMTFWACFASCVVCVSLLLDAFVTPFMGQMVVTGLLGVGYGISIQAMDVIVRFIFTDDRLVNALGWQGLCIGMAEGLGGLVAGWINEWTGSFNIAFYLYGGVTLLSIPLVLFQDRYAKRRSL